MLQPGLYVISKIDGKSSGSLGRIPLNATELERLEGDGHVYTVVNIATRRVSKFGSKSVRKNPNKRGKRKHAAKRPRHNPTPRKRTVSRAARAAAKRRIAKMPRDSKGRLKPKHARSNPRRSHKRKPARRRSRR